MSSTKKQLIKSSAVNEDPTRPLTETHTDLPGKVCDHSGKYTTFSAIADDGWIRVIWFCPLCDHTWDGWKTPLIANPNAESFGEYVRKVEARRTGDQHD